MQAIWAPVRHKIRSFLSLAACRLEDGLGGWATFSLMRVGRALGEELFACFFFFLRTGTLRFRWLHCNTRGSQTIYTARIYMHQFTKSSLPDRNEIRAQRIVGGSKSFWRTDGNSGFTIDKWRTHGQREKLNVIKLWLYWLQVNFQQTKSIHLSQVGLALT